jgi:hypothetical protein
MKGIAMRLLPTIARLKIGTAKNSSISHVNEISLIRLVFLQGIQIYAQNRHASPETLTAKNNSVMKMLACCPKKAHWHCELARTNNM